jgi:hypothetical protein
MYDIIAKVGLDSEVELKELVSERIRKIEGITGTNYYDCSRKGMKVSGIP